MSRIPRLCTLLTGNPLSWLILKAIGLSDLPKFASPGLGVRLRGRGVNTFSDGDLQKYDGSKAVLIIRDTFTSCFDNDPVVALVRILQRSGFQVLLSPDDRTGKPAHIKGFRERFRRTVLKNSSYFRFAANAGIPMVCVDPAAGVCFRDEYRQHLGKDDNWQIMLPQEFLLNHNMKTDKAGPEVWHLLPHCNEKAVITDSSAAWQKVFKNFGQELRIIRAGCCGMAGTYGHEHTVESEKIYKMSWQKHIHSTEYDASYIVTTGYSCRSQVRKFEGFRLKHPLEVLAELFEK